MRHSFHAVINQGHRKSSFVTALLLMVLGLFAVGCGGSSGGDFVYTGNPGGGPSGPTGPTGPIQQLGELIVEPDTLTFNNAGLMGLVSITAGNFDSLARFRAYFRAPGALEVTEVTPHVGVSFGSFVPDTVDAKSFAYIPLLGEGIAIGASPLGPTPAYGTTGIMTVTYIHDGVIYTDDVKLTVGNPGLVDVTTLGTPGGKLALPFATTDFHVYVMARYSNGLEVPSTPGEMNLRGDVIGMEVESTAGITVVPSTHEEPGIDVSTAETAGSAAIEFTANGDDDVLGSLEVNAINAQVEDVVLASDPLNVDPVGLYSVTLLLDDANNSKIDVTYLWPTHFVPDEDQPGYMIPVFSVLALFGTDPSGPVIGGRVLGVQKGTGVLSLTSDEEGEMTVQEVLEALGFSGVDGTADNNQIDVNIFSTVPLLDALGALGGLIDLGGEL